MRNLNSNTTARCKRATVLQFIGGCILAIAGTAQAEVNCLITGEWEADERCRHLQEQQRQIEDQQEELSELRKRLDRMTEQPITREPDDPRARNAASIFCESERVEGERRQRDYEQRERGGGAAGGMGRAADGMRASMAWEKYEQCLKEAEKKELSAFSARARNQELRLKLENEELKQRELELELSRRELEVKEAELQAREKELQLEASGGE